MEVKIGVQHVARELSIESEQEPDAILEALNTALKDESLFVLSGTKGQTLALDAEKIAYLHFTTDSGRPVGFGLVASS